MKNSKPLHYTKRHILGLIYRWKMLTTMQIQLLTDPRLSLNYVTVCVRELIKDKYICDAEVRSTQNYYRLRPRSLLEINFAEKPLKEDGIRSEHYSHDLIVNAFQIGELPVLKNKDQYEIITERELRSFANPCEMMSPDVFKIRRPDGLTFINDLNGYICIEIELSTKKKSRYEHSVKFYENKEIALVLWLAKDPSQIKLLQGIFGIEKHNYILLNDFIENYWDAKVATGLHIGKSVAQLHSIEKTEVPERQISPSLNRCFLDPIKKALHEGHSLFRDPQESECYL